MRPEASAASACWEEASTARRQGLKVVRGSKVLLKGSTMLSGSAIQASCGMHRQTRGA